MTNSNPGRAPSNGAVAPNDEPFRTLARSGDPGVADPSSLYRLLVETVRDYAIFALDATATSSPGIRAQPLQGLTAQEIIGQHFSVFYSAEDQAARKPQKELEIATAEGRVEDEGWRVRKDGSRFWANVVITALRNPTASLSDSRRSPAI